MTTAASFRARLLARQTLVGTFLKTPTGHGVEIIGDAGFDFVVIDQEHAPFDRSSTDVALAIACARGLPALVRVAGPETILSVLDGGATGILMPHVASVEQARAVVAACRYRGGARLRHQHARRPLHRDTDLGAYRPRRRRDGGDRPDRRSSRRCRTPARSRPWRASIRSSSGAAT